MHAKLPIVVLVCAATIGLAPLAGAETAKQETTLQDVKQESQDLIKTLKNYGVEQRDEAAEKTREALSELDQRIDELENRIDRDWQRMDQAARENARASLRALHRQRTQLAEWYGRFESSSAKAWEEMKKGLANSYSSLRDAWEKAEKEFAGDAR